MTSYYNEIDKYAAQWLRNLISAGLIAPGDVDERSIVDVKADDLRGYTQCHFFAGLGGWPYALRLAGWPNDRPVWTGSCPCQPFSLAGQGKAAGDERHLWPAWFPLIAECRPPTVIGEQVEAAVGRGWLDAVFADLEGESYACGASVLPACGVGAPHIRQRLWFVADANGGNASAERLQRSGEHGLVAEDSRTDELADAVHSERRPFSFDGQNERDGAHDGRQEARGNAGARGQVHELAEPESEQLYRSGDARRGRREFTNSSPWRDLEWLACTDGKSRPTQRGFFPLAHGIPGRVGRLRAYGNAIVPPLAAQFIAAFMECAP